MLLVKKITLSLGIQDIFDNLSFSLNYDDKVGVLGRNGAGKSTLLRVLAKLQPIDGGHIAYSRTKTIAYLPQEEVMSSEKTVLEETVSSYGDLLGKQAELQKIEKQLSDGTTSHHAQELLDHYQKLQNELTSFNQDEIYALAREVLTGLGFSGQRISQKDFKLSTG